MMNHIYKRIATLFLVASLSVISLAQPTQFSRTANEINVGILLIESTSSFWGANTPPNPSPFVFFNLERRRDLKPAGWELKNPAVSTQVTASIEARWTAIYSALGLGASPFVRGERLAKNMAPYWEVSLSALSADSIKQFDVLLVNGVGVMSLNAVDREKIRAFLDKGGILWFDKSNNVLVDGFNSFPLQFTTTPSGVNPVVIEPGHPIFKYPYSLSASEALFLGLNQGTHAIQRQTLSGLGLAGYEQIFQTIDPDFDFFRTVVANNAGIVVGVAQVGNGFIVVTSGNISFAINSPTGGTNLGGLGPNSGPIAGDNFDKVPSLESKFAYNIISLSAEHRAPAKGTRRLNATNDDLGAPLLQVWNEPNLDNDQGSHTNYVPPCIYKGLVFVTAGNRLYALKADPSQDLDGDGWTDDGMQDSSIGATYDMVWMSTPLVEPLSPPIAVEQNEVSGNATKDMIMLVDGQGRLVAFNSHPKDANGRLLGPNPIAPLATITAPGAPPLIDLAQNNRGPYAPTYFEGLVYVYDMYQGGVGQRFGRVWAVDPSSLTLMQSGLNPWVLAGTGSPNLPEPGTVPTIGYIPVADGGGGEDKVMYVSNRSSLTGAPNGVTSLWLGAKGETPTLVRTATHVDVITRASSKNLSVYNPIGEHPLGIRIHLIDDNGNTLSAIDAFNLFDGNIIQYSPGRLRLGLKTSLPANVNIRIDYTIDLGTGVPQLLNNVIRGQLLLPDDITRGRYVVKGMALAPNGNLFITTSNELTNGDLFCVNEYTRGSFTLVYRWTLHEGFTVTLNGTQNVQVPSALVDRDDLWLLTGLGYPTLRRLHFHGQPVIVGDVCYVNVSADQSFGFFTTQGTYILAFDANPSRIDIRYGTSLPSGYRIKQPDIAASNFKSRPERFVNLQGNQTDVDMTSGVIRFNNMMSNNVGQMQNAFSTSMPIIFSAAGIPETLFDPNSTGSKWSPLLWYFGVGGMRTNATLMAMGNTLYLAGGSVLPSVFQGQFPPTPVASIFAMDATIPPNDISIITIPGQPGLKQSRWLIQTGQGWGFEGNKYVRWPSGEGIQSFQEFQVRVNQTVLDPNQDEALGVVGGEGVLVSWADQGVFGFKRATTLIADEGRVIEVDSAGFARWASDVSFENDLYTSGKVRTVKLQRPTKAYKFSENEYVVVDTGSDRVVVLDKSAGELRSISNFILDATYRPDGWRAGDSQNLRQPRDVAVWGDFVPAGFGPINLTGPPRYPLEFWVHYLIADTGNRRLIEIVDRYIADPATFTIQDVVRDASGNPQLGVLIWHTPSDISGKNYQYTAINRFQIGVDNTGAAQYVYAAAIGDAMATRESLGLDPPSGTGTQETAGGPGTIMIFDNINGNQVINEVFLPDGTTRKKLSGVNSIALRAIGLSNGFSDYSITFTDRTGVYEIARVGNDWVVRWMITNEVYENIRGVKLRAASAKFLPNGHLLLTNSYYGQTNNGQQFFGEVTQWFNDSFDYSAPNYNFNSLSIRAIIRSVVGTRGLRIPQFADRF